ncbi:MAG: glutaredoxin 3 [Gammaproteobacteria bacterium]
MPEVVMYSSGFCPYCVRARGLLEHKGVRYTEIRVDLEPGLYQEMHQRSGRSTVPQIFIGSHHVGGCDDLYALERQGDLDPLLNTEV